jgi:5'-nucleotidase
MFQETAESCMVSGNKDTPIGNLVSDAFRALTGTPIAVEVGGSTAQPLYPGPLVAADLFRVVGYGFNTENGLGYRLATFSMRGADLLQGIEYGLSSIETRDEFLLQASGLTYAYDPTDPAFSRLVGVKVGDVPLNPSATYMITSNEFVPSFLGAIGIRYGNLHVFHGDTTEFQVLVRYIAACDTIRPRVEGRVVSTVSRPPRETPIAVPEKSNRGGYR